MLWWPPSAWPAKVLACASSVPAAAANVHYVAGPAAGKNATIIFVHGVTGHHLDTWRSKAKRGRESVFWPDLVKSDPRFDAFDVVTYGYRSPRVLNGAGIQELADDMYRQLRRHSILDESRRYCTMPVLNRRARRRRPIRGRRAL